MYDLFARVSFSDPRSEDPINPLVRFSLYPCLKIFSGTTLRYLLTFYKVKVLSNWISLTYVSPLEEKFFRQKFRSCVFGSNVSRKWVKLYFWQKKLWLGFLAKRGPNGPIMRFVRFYGKLTRQKSSVFCIKSRQHIKIKLTENTSEKSLFLRFFGQQRPINVF